MPDGPRNSRATARREYLRRVNARRGLIEALQNAGEKLLEDAVTADQIAFARGLLDRLALMADDTMPPRRLVF